MSKNIAEVILGNTVTTMLNDVALEILPVGKKNNLEDSYWYICNNHDDKYKVINWDKYDAPERWKLLIKMDLLNFCGGYSSTATQDIYNSGSSIKTFLGTSSRFFNAFDEVIGGPKNLAELTLTELKEILLLISTRGSKLLSKSTASDYTKLVTRLKRNYDKGVSPDGITINLPQKTLEFMFRDIVESYGLRWHEWTKGGSFQTIPASVAMLLLARCLEINDSVETKATELYFKYLRSNDFDETKFWASIKGKRQTGIIERIERLLKTKSDAKERARIKLFLSEMQAITDGKTIFLSKAEFSKHVQLIYDYLTTGFMMLTGYRLIEIRHIAGNDIKLLGNDEIEFPTTPRKTKHFPTVRSVSSLTAKFIMRLINCSDTDKILHNKPVFSRTRSSTRLNDDVSLIGVPDNTMRHRLTDCWNDFISHVSVDEQVSQFRISPHALRHVWVDVALRCNVPENGWNNVTEQIRHHLRHRFGSTWTRRYMDGKFTKENMRELEESYFIDLFKRVGGDGAPEFFGPIAKRFRQVIGETKFVHTSETDELENLIKEQVEGLISVNTHPWGLCVLMKDTEVQAKCYDKLSNMPDTDKKSSFENCSGCIHRLTHKSNKEYVQKYVIAHQDFLERYPLSTTRLRKVSEDAVTMGMKVLKDMTL